MLPSLSICMYFWQFCKLDVERKEAGEDDNQRGGENAAKKLTYLLYNSVQR